MPNRLMAIALIGSLLVLTIAVPAAFAAASLTVHDLDTSDYPNVSMQMSLPADMVKGSSGSPTVSVKENGEFIDDVSVVAVESNRQPAYVVLVVDTSGSMKGAPIADAKAAARRFVGAMGPDARIAIVSFADEPKTLTGFTNDPERLKTAIESLKASGETAVYDALVTAARLVPQDPQARRSIVLLSDGTDTVSSTNLQNAMEAVKTRGAPVYAVALRSKDFNPKALGIVAKGSGGRLVPVARSRALGGLFEGIALELKDVWTVNYKSRQAQTKDINVDVVAKLGSQTGSTELVYANPEFAGVGLARALSIPEIRNNPAALLGAVLLAFFAVALLVGAVMLLALPGRGRLDNLQYYDQLHSTANEAAAADPDGVRARVVDAVGYVAGKRGFTALLRQKLEAAGLPLRPAEYMTVHLLAVVVTGFMVELSTGEPLAAFMAIVLVTVVPILLLNIAVDKRRTRFNEQLPDVLNMLSSSLRGGWGIQQAIDLVVQEVPPPSSPEFKRVLTEARLGIPLDDALQRMADRLQSQDFQTAVTAIAIQREVGGNLAEVLDIVASTIRERASLRRQISALTAEGRLSAYILIALPIFELLVLYFINPRYLEPFLTTGFGTALAVGGVAALVVGSVWLFRVTRIEV